MIAGLAIRALALLAGAALATAVYYFVSAFLFRIRKPTTRGDRRGRRPEALGAERMRAFIACGSAVPATTTRFAYAGLSDCRTLALFYGGNLACDHGCLGLGSCARHCPRDAIRDLGGRMAVTEECDGCGLCLKACPKGLISLVPFKTIGTAPCAGHRERDLASVCPVAAAGSTIDAGRVPTPGFKIWKKWAILCDKLR